ncbi:hypothetical protein ACFYUR_19240 [Micromonospora haikouensis]|uniref:hypothetical protein n=1 Tax=Micromonospora haikouensis TaxID=686309 RepID=UPI0036B1C093
MAARLVVPVDLDAFLDLIPFDPYRNPPWRGCRPLDRQAVNACRASNPGRRDWADSSHPTRTHTARVAWLTRNWANDGSDPIEVEVFNGVTVNDGWHRIAAAIARDDHTVYVEVSGLLAEAQAYGFPVED